MSALGEFQRIAAEAARCIERSALAGGPELARALRAAARNAADDLDAAAARTAAWLRDERGRIDAAAAPEVAAALDHLRQLCRALSGR